MKAFNKCKRPKHYKLSNKCISYYKRKKQNGIIEVCGVFRRCEVCCIRVPNRTYGLLGTKNKTRRYKKVKSSKIKH